MRDPAFWWEPHSYAAALLAPAARLYGAVAAKRMARPGTASSVPVVCVGNFTLGGGGKTPTAIAIAKHLLAAGRRPFFLSRGYGGRLAGPVRVDGHRADEVGDEPLLLARVAPTIVARDRPAGARAAADAGANVVVMDDGLQNASLVKDFTVAVIDGRRSIGNGRVFPAGPLRAPLAAQLDRVDAVLVIGGKGGGTGVADQAAVDAAARGLPVVRGELRPDPAAVAALAGRPVLAFAGIADPGKFFATLEACGIPIAARMPFPDHHAYTPAEVAALLARADREHLTMVTTEKDVARIGSDHAGLIARVVALPVALVFVGTDFIRPAVLRAVERGARRMG